MPTRNVNLTQHFDRFIQNGVVSGRFSNASEVVREGLRLLEQREAEDRARVDWLRQTAQEAFAELDRGEGMTLGSTEEIDTLVRESLTSMRNADRASVPDANA